MILRFSYSIIKLIVDTSIRICFDHQTPSDRSGILRVESLGEVQNVSNEGQSNLLKIKHV